MRDTNKLLCAIIPVLLCVLSVTFPNMIGASFEESLTLKSQHQLFCSELLLQQGGQYHQEDTLDFAGAEKRESLRQNLKTANHSSSPYQTYYEIEPNNYAYQANLVNNNYYGQTYYYIYGNITNFYFDLDYYRFDVTKSGTFDILGIWVGDYAGLGWEDDLYIVLLDANENIIAVANYFGYGSSAYQLLSKHVTPGTYYVVVFASDKYGDLYVGEWYGLALEFYADTATVSTPATPSGPSTGTTHTTYSYSTGGSVCSNGHSVQYRFDWGDGSFSNWSASTTSTKFWSSPGNYQVKAQARCAVDTSVVSLWSSARTVSIFAPLPSRVSRIAGTNRYHTAVLVSMAGWPDFEVNEAAVALASTDDAQTRPPGKQDNEDEVEVLILLKEQADSRGAALNALKGRAMNAPEQKAAVRSAVFQALQETSAVTQAPLIRYLEGERGKGRVSEIKSYFIVNLVYARVSPELVDIITRRPDVDSVWPNHRVQMVEPVFQGETAAAGIEWNVNHIRASKVWNELSIDGSGVVVGVIDSGVDWQHEALMTKYRGYIAGSPGNPSHAYNWFDPIYNSSFPDDWQGHGTHVAGTILGTDPAGNNQIGVAPGAGWIAARGLSDEGTGSIEQLLACMQFMLAPTPNQDGTGTPDPTKAPDIVNNSWGVPSTDCFPIFTVAIQNWQNAGILPVFSAGNEGPASQTITLPAYYWESFAVGAIDSSNNLATFSSRGPGPCGSFWKPDISAPGVSIRSALSYNPVTNRPRGYAISDGTSMAAPHVAGVAALLRQVNPNLTVDQLEQILTSTAVPLTSSSYPTSPNHGFGYGRVDAYNAVMSFAPPIKTNTVVLARGDNFADALAGITLAYHLDAPILLTATSSLNSLTKQEIERLGTSRVIILGGLGAISAGVEAALQDMPSIDWVDRLGGENRYETAKLIAEELGTTASFDTAFLASGLGFPDALAAASYGAMEGYPILLTGKDRLPQATKEVFDNIPSMQKVVIVGGEAVISSAVEAELLNLGLNVERIMGANRYDTAVELAKAYMKEDAQEIFISTGLNFPDALAGGVLAAKRGTGVLLVMGNRTTLPPSVEDFIFQSNINRATILGGESAVSEGMQISLEELLQ